MCATIRPGTFCPLVCWPKDVKIRIYKTIILPVVLHGCETLSLTLRGKNRLGEFENMVLERIFEPKRDEMTVGSREQHNEELLELCSSPSIIRIVKTRTIRWAAHVAQVMKNRNTHLLLMGKPEGRRSLGRRRRKWLGI
jgi:hypothetical protein